MCCAGLGTSMPRRPGNSKAAADERIPFAERITCSVSDAEAASGVSRSQLYLEMRNGKLEYVKRGTRRYIRVPSLLRLLGA